MVNRFTGKQLFGALFHDDEVAGHFSAPAFLAQMLRFERAYSEGLRAVGMISDAACQAALSHLDQVQLAPDLLAAGSDKDGLPVPALVAALRAGMDETTAAAIHSGATSQDVLDTAMVLTLQEVLTLFDGRLSAILAQLDALIARFGDQPLTARTRMQAALRAQVADRLRQWQQPLAGQLDALSALKGTLAVQFGGPTGKRDIPNGKGDALAQHLRDSLGLPGEPEVWHTDRRRIVEVGHWMTLTTGTLGKIGQDIALMSQQGIDEITLSGAGSSSAMPHKQNPVRAEILIALARYVATQQGLLSQALIHEQERSGQAWALEWLTLPAMIEAAGAALTGAHRLLMTIERIGTP